MDPAGGGVYLGGDNYVRGVGPDCFAPEIGVGGGGVTPDIVDRVVRLSVVKGDGVLARGVQVILGIHILGES